MKIRELMKDVVMASPLSWNGIGDLEADDLTEDSRLVKAGTVFVCERGHSFDGHDFAAKALELGAPVVVTSRDLGLKNQLIAADTRAAYCRMCSNFYGRPEDKLRLFGVTGTNGKSSSTHFIYELLGVLGYRAGLIGTLGTRSSGSSAATANTTPECHELEKIFRAFADDKDEFCVMEVSSQGLALDRVDTCHFEVGAFTNLTRDHLDFHGTFENYAAAKAKLFAQSDISVINTDDPYAAQMAAAAAGRVVTFSVNDPRSDWRAGDISLSPRGISYTLSGGGRSAVIKAPLFGMFSVYNTMTALVSLISDGWELDSCVEALSGVKPVKGRMERLDTDTPYTIYIDYAHSPDALENVIGALRQVTRGRVITVFGCGGDRDHTKRPIMGEAASRLSDICVVTSDNPRTEDPGKIISDIVAGIKRDNYVTVTDRYAAIERALSIAGPDDAVLLAGKGHEDYIIIGHEKHHFDEREAVKKILG